MGRLGQVHGDLLLIHHRTGDHEDDEQHQEDVHQGRDVYGGDDFVVGGVRGGHQSSLPAVAACRLRATIRPRTSRAPSRTSLDFCLRTLKKTTAGMATIRPTAVAMRAWEMETITS